MRSYHEKRRFHFVSAQKESPQSLRQTEINLFTDYRVDYRELYELYGLSRIAHVES